MSSWQHHVVNVGYLFLGKENAEDPVSLRGVGVTMTKGGRPGKNLFLTVTRAGEAD